MVSQTNKATPTRLATLPKDPGDAKRRSLDDRSGTEAISREARARLGLTSWSTTKPRVERNETRAKISPPGARSNQESSATRREPRSHLLEHDQTKSRAQRDARLQPPPQKPRLGVPARRPKPAGTVLYSVQIGSRRICARACRGALATPRRGSCPRTMFLGQLGAARQPPRTIGRGRGGARAPVASRHVGYDAAARPPGHFAGETDSTPASNAVFNSLSFA